MNVLHFPDNRPFPVRDKLAEISAPVPTGKRTKWFFHKGMTYWLGNDSVYRVNSLGKVERAQFDNITFEGPPA